MLPSLSLIGDQTAERTGGGFRAINPADGAQLEPIFHSATPTDIDRAAKLAESAFPTFSGRSGRDRAKLLRRIAEGLASEGTAIVDRAHLETGLPM
jgi:2,5-dioxopentanoate dehydrogenase